MNGFYGIRARHVIIAALGSHSGFDQVFRPHDSCLPQHAVARPNRPLPQAADD